MTKLHFNIKKLLFIFVFPALLVVLAAIVGGAVRVNQLVSDIDYSTGFFVSEHGVFSDVLAIIIIGFFAAYAILLALPRAKKFDLKHKKSTAAWQGLLCAAAAATLVAFATAQKHAPYTALDWLAAFALLINIICLAYAAYSSYAKKEQGTADIAFLMPVVYTSIFLVAKFLTFTSILTISERALDVLSSSALILFLLFNTKHICGVGEKSYEKLASALAFLAGVLGATTYFSAELVFLFGGESVRAFVNPPTFWQLTLTAYALWTAIPFHKIKKCVTTV